MRAASQLLALLISEAIVVGLAVAGSGILSNILLRQSPRGGSLVLAGFEWWWEEREGNGFVIYVRGVVSNIGVDEVNITGVWVAINGVNYNLRFTANANLKSNEWTEVFANGKIVSLPNNSRLTVFVRYCTISKCSVSFVGANIKSSRYLVREVYYTITLPGYTTVTRTRTYTVTYTYTVTSNVGETSTVISTLTETVTSAATATQTNTVTVTTTVITTATATKPAWPVKFEACYDVNNNINVYGVLQKPVRKEPIPYIVKYLRCNVFGCDVLAVKVFEWKTDRTFYSRYRPVSVGSLSSLRIEIWSVDWYSSKIIQKIYDQTVDTSIRCA